MSCLMAMVKKSSAVTLRAMQCLGAASMAVALHAGAQTWAPNETQISPQPDLLDPEYNQARAQFTWSDAQGFLWVGNIDPATGLFFPPNGKGFLVDSETITADDTLLTLNGPEWVWSASGDGVAYTKFTSSAHRNNTARLAFAKPQPDGTWAANFLDSAGARKAPYGSETANDPKPRITYVDKDKNHYWREVDDPATEQPLPGTPIKVGPVRHVRGARAVAYAAPVNNVQQAFYRDLDTGQVTQLTFDAGDKSEVWMWQAPEFNNEFVFMAMVGNNELRIYRKLSQTESGSAQWTPISSAFAPSRDTFTSPEPFTYKGKSYIFLAMIIGNDSFPSEIWIANIDSAAPLLRRVSDNTLYRARTDPEVFAAASGLYIYYNRRTLSTTSKKTKPCPGVECSEGIFRADTGLGP